MSECEGISTLIDNIYDAALWVSVLVKAREFVGGHAAALYGRACAG
jgi:hypothetical protein